MTKRQLIDLIRQFNVTAQPQFLEQFDEEALGQYLEHLEDARNKRLRFDGQPPMTPTRLRMVS